jgi:hypothetical protein
LPATAADVTTTGGTVNYLPIFNGADTIIDSAVFQTGTGATAKVGINTTTPASTLDVKGGGTIRGTLALPATAAATATAGKDSQPLSLAASAFNSTSGTALNQTFHLQAEPAANDTTAPSGTLNLLFGEGANAPAETGLKISSKGIFTFATGQTFPGTGDGTVTSVASGAGLTGGPITGTGTLSIATGGVTNAMLATAYAQLGAANLFTGNQTVTGNLSATGVVTGSGFQIGSNLFAYGSSASGNTLLGFAGNTTMTGGGNTAGGFQALFSNTTGTGNTASGFKALFSNTAAYNNTAVGSGSLFSNTTGALNTTSGSEALSNNTTGGEYTGMGAFAGVTLDSSNGTGNNNTALGFGSTFSTGSLNYATAIGASSEVDESNALVLGSVASSQSCQQGGGCPNINVGIGTTTPGAPLEIDGSNQTDLWVKAPASGVGSAIDLFTTGTGAQQWEILDTGAGASQGASKLNVRNVTLGWDVLTIVEGVVGIGTTSPDNTLSVNGSADKPGGGSWGTFSDARLKTVNGGFTGGLSQVMKIQPIHYRYKPDNAMGIRDTDEHIGVVAQDVQKIIPEAVTENSKGYLLVNNDPIIWTMLNAIKKQQKEIRALRSELRATRQTLQKVKAQIAAPRPTLVATK